MTAQQLADLVQEQQAVEAAALEEQVTAEAEGDTEEALAAVLAGALAGWVATFGALGAAGTGTTLAAYLARVRRDAGRAVQGLDSRAPLAIARALEDAAAMGARHAAAFAARAGATNVPVPGANVSRDALAAARAVADTVRAQLRLSEALLSPRSVSGSGWRGVVTSLAAARRAVSLVRSAAAWAVHRAISDGAAQAIEAIGARQLWVAERDACVNCLAYSGRLSDRDGRWPGGLSFDPAQRSTTRAAIDGPPLHTNCRCRPVPWIDEWAPAGATSLPDLLRRQAERSITSGSGRPTESHAARTRAAQAFTAHRHTPARLRRRRPVVGTAGRP